MKFSNESIEMLLDLVEIKISSLFVYDKEDSKMQKNFSGHPAFICRLLPIGHRRNCNPMMGLMKS